MELWWASEKEPDCGAGINLCTFIKDLDIKDEEDDPDKNSKSLDTKCITMPSQ